MRRSKLAWLTAAVASAAIVPAGFVACGGQKKMPTEQPKGALGVARSAYDGGDRSKCEYEGRTDRDVVETAGPGAIVPNIRRVYAILGQGDTARKVIICREVDTNLDGVKDVVRTYDDEGQALREEADSDFDGRIDTWVSFSAGRMAKVQTDNNADGQPDEHRFYVRGKLTRVQRDTNYSGGGECEGVDVWEIYSEGKLERMGVDVNDDCQVDRWDRDEIAMRERLEKEREEEEEDGGADDGGASDGGVTDAYVSPRNR